MAYRLEIKERKKGTYLVIENKYWDKERKKSITEHPTTLGYVSDLLKDHTDLVDHFSIGNNTCG